ncbi:hypothetical protein D3C86_1546490 [compost metagenome]
MLVAWLIIGLEFNIVGFKEATHGEETRVCQSKSTSIFGIAATVIQKVFAEKDFGGIQLKFQAERVLILALQAFQHIEDLNVSAHLFLLGNFLTLR